MIKSPRKIFLGDSMDKLQELGCKHFIYSDGGLTLWDGSEGDIGIREELNVRSYLTIRKLLGKEYMESNADVTSQLELLITKDASPMMNKLSYLIGIRKILGSIKTQRTESDKIIEITEEIYRLQNISDEEIIQMGKKEIK